jgi:hypothetical protein
MANPFETTERIMQTFRMPRDLVAFLKSEAATAGRDLTPHVNRYLEGLRSWFGLPDAAVRLLDADRAAMKLGRFEYLLHLLYLRSLELREKGPGFDAPRAEKTKGSGR